VYSLASDGVLCQQIVTILWITEKQEIGADGVENDRREKGNGIRAIIPQSAEDGQGGKVLHVHAQMGSQNVVEIEPAGGHDQELLGGVNGEQVRAIELLIIGAMAPFHPAIVLLPAQGVADQSAA